MLICQPFENNLQILLRYASSNMASGKMRGEVMEEVASHLLFLYWVFRQTCLLLFNTAFNVVRQLLQRFALLGEKEEKGRKNIK